MTERRRRRRAGGKISREPIDEAEMLAPARSLLAQGHARHAHQSACDGDTALDAIFPWLAQNAMIHLTVPHGLEQYTGARLGHARRLPGARRVPAGAAA